jgi:transcription elongation factor/antiterminator RfaH
LTGRVLSLKWLDSHKDYLVLGTFSPRWYAVQTQPRREGFAALQLEKQNYQVFYPRQLKSVRHARRLEHRQVGYFPGYIFVALDLGSAPWRSVNGTFGVRSLVMFGDRPAPLPDGFVEYLQASVDEHGLVNPAVNFNPGDKVRILSGPFADIIGTMDRLEGAARVRILMDLVGGVIPLVADTQNVVLAGS